MERQLRLSVNTLNNKKHLVELPFILHLKEEAFSATSAMPAVIGVVNRMIGSKEADLLTLVSKEVSKNPTSCNW